MRDVVLTTATTAASALALIAVTRVVAQGLGAQQFGAYSIARQVFTWLSPFSTLAMGTAVARYTATASSPRQQVSYLLNGTLLATGVAAILLLIGVLTRASAAAVLFQSRDYAPVLTSALLLVFGYGFYAVLYGYYRGTGRMGRANLLQLVLAALGPLAVAASLARTGRTDLLLILMGASYAIAFVGILIETIAGRAADRVQVISAAPKQHPSVELMRYGLPRVPGGLALGGMLAVGPFLAPRVTSLRDAGFLAAGQSVFALAEAGVAAFGLVALPRAAQLLSQGQHDYLRRGVSDILVFALHLGLFAAVQLAIWAEPVIVAWLGPEYRDAAGLMRLLLVALVPYLIYVLLRSIIDAIEPRAVNSRNLYIALGVTVAACILLSSVGLREYGLAAGTALGFVTLGVLTVAYLRGQGWIALPEIRARRFLALNAGAALIALSTLSLVSKGMGAGAQLAIALLLESVLLLFYTHLLRRAGVRWVLEVEHRIVRTSRP